MLHQNDLKIGQPQSLGLGAGRIAELGGGKDRRRNAGFLKKDSVVHTARCTRPSIGQGFNNQMALLGQLLARVSRRRTGKGRLHTPDDLSRLKLGCKPLGEPVEKEIALGFADIEQANRLAAQIRDAGGKRGAGLHRGGGRVVEFGHG